MESEKFQKSRIVPKKVPVKNTKQGSLVCFLSSGSRCFCFGRGSGVSSMFSTSIVQVDDVEEMNKKRTVLSEKSTRIMQSYMRRRNEFFCHRKYKTVLLYHTQNRDKYYETN